MSFRTTYRQDKKTYVEDRGYAYPVTSGSAEYEALDAEFGKILKVGQTAVRNADGDGWIVEDGFPLLERMKEAKLAILDAKWRAAEASGKVQSSAGFVIDANERANRDVDGLIKRLTALGDDSADFCAADNSYHTVTLEQLKAMQLEIIQYGQGIYAKKWELRTAIANAVTVADLEAVEISFASA